MSERGGTGNATAQKKTDFIQKVAQNFTTNRPMFVRYLRCTEFLCRANNVIQGFDAAFLSRVRERSKDGEQAANELFLQRLEDSRDRGKWQSFVTILHQTGYVYLHKLLTGEPVSVDRERYVKIVELLTSTIRQKVKPADLLADLVAEGCINDIDKQNIESAVTQFGNIAGAELLLSRVTRLRDDWFRGLMTALYQAGMITLMEEIDPDFTAKLLDGENKTPSEFQLSDLDLRRSAVRVPCDSPMTSPLTSLPDDEPGTVCETQVQQSHTNYTWLYQKMKVNTYSLIKENENLKRKINDTKFGYNVLLRNPYQLVYYTGLPNANIFKWLIDKLQHSVEVLECLCIEDHLLVILMTLRRGMCNKDIAFRFKVSESSISEILETWLPVMATSLQSLIKWPSKEAIRNSMPEVFKEKFERCRCIIDFFEIRIDRPTDLTLRAQTWSRYKHQNTIKYLIGITPTGAISFLSDGWVGETSHTQVAVESGFLELLEFNDEILADRELSISDKLAARGATLKIPPLTNEVDTSRQLSQIRRHVERVIDRWKNFEILQSIIPLSQAFLFDDIVKVCGALTNLCLSAVAE